MGGRETLTHQLADYGYDLPDELIAQTPSQERPSSRLLVLNRSSHCLEHRRFEDLCGYLRAGDTLVLNNTRVVPARLHGIKETGGRVELLVLNPYKEPLLGEAEGYDCLIKAAKHTNPGSLIALRDGARAELLSTLEDGKACVRFLSSEPLLDLLDRIGEVPLPPYIRREEEHPCANDAVSYQTVYARRPGAVAAPTAGLHFSGDLLCELESSGIEAVEITLHVGYGTFSPIREKDVRRHRMHPEYIEISIDSAKRIQNAKREGRRIVAVGTTVVRTLEWVAGNYGEIKAFSGFCNHYIYPGYGFRVVDAMITNFHLPKSTLLLLISAFAGRESVLHAYREAVVKGYRFFSYGDAMLIL